MFYYLQQLPSFHQVLSSDLFPKCMQRLMLDTKCEWWKSVILCCLSEIRKQLGQPDNLDRSAPVSTTSSLDMRVGNKCYNRHWNRIKHPVHRPSLHSQILHQVSCPGRWLCETNKVWYMSLLGRDFLFGLVWSSIVVLSIFVGERLSVWFWYVLGRCVQQCCWVSTSCHSHYQCLLYILVLVCDWWLICSI
jgi:hypothetical protein